MRKLAGALVIAFGLIELARCGKSEAEKESEASAGRGPLTCEGSALSAAPQLPAGFPSVGAITFVKSTKAGPSTVVDGYSTSNLKTMHDG